MDKIIRQIEELWQQADELMKRFRETGDDRIPAHARDLYAKVLEFAQQEGLTEESIISVHSSITWNTSALLIRQSLTIPMDTQPNLLIYVCKPSYTWHTHIRKPAANYYRRYAPFPHSHLNKPANTL